MSGNANDKNDIVVVGKRGAGVNIVNNNDLIARYQHKMFWYFYHQKKAIADAIAENIKGILRNGR